MKSENKRPFEINEVLNKVRQATLPYPKATLFELALRGYGSLFQQLIACVISIRTLDEISLPLSISLFELAKTPGEILKISVSKIDEIISKCTFHTHKAYRIREIARIAQENYGSQLPCDRSVIESLPGIGPKCASLALGISCGILGVAVDIHVFRVTHRWGYVEAKTPEKAAKELESKLPKEHWIELNALLVPFGKHICTRSLPRCSKCPVLTMCRQVDVEKHR
jgi:endonuclease III